MKKTKLLLIALTCLIQSPNTYIVNAETNLSEAIEIKSSVDEDLQSFQIDYKKYQVEANRVYEPIMINYLESNSKDYYDLIYFYDPLNSFNIKTIYAQISGGNDYSEINPLFTKEYSLIASGTSEDGTIKRYAIDGFDNYRINYKYKRYDFTKLYYNDTFCNLDNSYIFNPGEQEYSNCVNVRLEDVNAWSWHFDENLYTPDIWQSICDWLFNEVSKDTLRDQLFYSFYVDNWDISNIKSVDMKYKKVLLDGNRHNIADTGADHEFYEGSENIDEGSKSFLPKFYKWNEENTINNYDRSEYLGATIAEITSKVDFTYQTIDEKEIVKSEGLRHKYEWSKIQNNDEFSDVFGKDSEIVKFANQFMQNKSKKYWIINFDSFFYSFEKTKVLSFIDTADKLYPVHDYFLNNQNTDFAKYLDSYHIENYGDTYLGFSDFEIKSNQTYVYYNYYSFTQEYTFDIQMTNITFEDSNKNIFSLPVSVATVDQRSSGGFPDSPREAFAYWWLVNLIVAIIIALIVINIVAPIIKLFTITNSASKNTEAKTTKATTKKATSKSRSKRKKKR